MTRSAQYTVPPVSTVTLLGKLAVAVATGPSLHVAVPFPTMVDSVDVARLSTRRRWLLKSAT